MAKPGKRWKFEKILKLPSALAKRHRAKKAQAEEISEMIEKGIARAERRGEDTKSVKRRTKAYALKNPEVYLKALEISKKIFALHPEEMPKEELELEQLDAAIGIIRVGIDIPKGFSGNQPLPYCDLQIMRLKNGKMKFIIIPRPSEGISPN